MQDNGKVAYLMDMVKIIILMVAIMKEDFLMEFHMDLVDLSIIMVIIIKDK